LIPDFQEDGYLPPGIHVAGFEELSERFGGPSEIRRVQTESIEWLIKIAWRAGALRLVINGSYATDVLEPNDVDCVLLVDDSFPKDQDAESELLAGVPFLEIQIVKEIGFALLVEEIFATDRSQNPKGLMEVLL